MNPKQQGIPGQRTQNKLFRSLPVTLWHAKHREAEEFGHDEIGKVRLRECDEEGADDGWHAVAEVPGLLFEERWNASDKKR
jgi:hypothetical protein